MGDQGRTGAQQPVHRVLVQLEPPTEHHPGRVTEGFYVLNGTSLTMTHEDGEPVHPERFRTTVDPGQKPESIARVLTRQVRLEFMGRSETEDKFARSISYPAMGVV